MELITTRIIFGHSFMLPLQGADAIRHVGVAHPKALPLGWYVYGLQPIKRHSALCTQGDTRRLMVYGLQP